MSAKKEILQIVFICTALIGVVMVGESLRVSEAKFTVDDHLKSPTLKSVDVSKMTSAGEAESKAKEMVNGFFGESSAKLYGDLSKYGAVARARQNAMGVFSEDQIAGGGLEVATNLSKLSQDLATEALYNNAAVDSAMNAEFFDDKTLQGRKSLDEINANFKKMAEGLLDIKKMYGEAQSRLPSLPSM